MLGRAVSSVAATLALLLFPASTGHATSTAAPRIPLPAPGDVTVARLTIQSSGRTNGPPRLSLDARQLSKGAFAAATVNRLPGGSRYGATVAIFAPRPENSPAQGPTPAPAKDIVLELSPGFTAVGAAQVVHSALYTNRLPSFALLAGGTASVLGGSPPMLPAAQIVRDAELLALDRSVPLADMGLLGLEFVTVQLAKVGSIGLRVTVGTSRLHQVSAIELRFPSGVTVSQVTGGAGTGTIRVGNPVQLVATEGVFRAGVPYGFTFRLSRPLKKGDYVAVRASTHYFESSLPFTERFYIG
jgi:hypothetical protein